MSGAQSSEKTAPGALQLPVLSALYGAALSIVTGVIVGVVVYHLTTSGPDVELAISQPVADLGKDRLRQIVVIENRGSNLAKGIQVYIESMRHRILEKIIYAKPALLKPCDEGFTAQDDLYLVCGDLPPQGSISIVLVYRRPALDKEEVDAFSDNTTVEKTRRRRSVIGARG